MLDGTTRTIKADREEVLGALRSNREKHIAEYREAVKGCMAWAAESWSRRRRRRTPSSR